MPLPSIERLLRERLAGTLPGVEAQMKFAPVPARRGWRPGEFPADTRPAAALLLLYPHTHGVAVPLTETLAQAALREASEEIGVDPSSVRVLGELTPVHVIVSGFTLHPVVAVTEQRPDFVAAPDEVELILEVSLDELRDASRIRTRTAIREGVAVEYPYFDLLGHQVWGATAMVLGEFVYLLRDEDP
jgi:8-oxo-dGTP pyrophosphatase MutT (NUDIX family)